jgi:hypothetical protein
VIGKSLRQALQRQRAAPLGRGTMQTVVQPQCGQQALPPLSDQRSRDVTLDCPNRYGYVPRYPAMRGAP